VAINLEEKRLKTLSEESIMVYTHNNV
jgi:hypothetical protein